MYNFPDFVLYRFLIITENLHKNIDLKSPSKPFDLIWHNTVIEDGVGEARGEVCRGSSVEVCSIRGEVRYKSTAGVEECREGRAEANANVVISNRIVLSFRSKETE
ncbi:hypothetical protein RCL_jg10372.t1 [Rhizophagus clarus]|uniref:Uncharacterized protein n=1 Tax=Rhizophagus clarus TaxID=94130 RepID=A0A8H3QF76_9GLOM|nr:hypothetical protein RCL_jg10372.t1 [Rhizophagus clarus]